MTATPYDVGAVLWVIKQRVQLDVVEVYLALYVERHG
jgi:hypothetical protein